MAAVLAIIEFLAPCRFDGFDPNELGGCKAKPVHMPLVQICATSEAQTENTFRMVRAMLPRGGKVCTKYNLDPGKTMYFLPPEGKLHVVTSSAATLEGAEATFAIGDETEHWLPNNGGIELMATLEDNLAKSGSRMVETNNAWKEGTESVSEDTFAGWVAQEEGRTVGETSVLYDARISYEDIVPGDRDGLRASLEHVYDDCWWVDIDAIIERILDPKADVEDSKRKYFNQPTSTSGAWVKLSDWTAVRDVHKPLVKGDEITLGFDGSLTNDATVLAATRVSDGHSTILASWEPTEGEEISVAEVDDAVDRAFDTFKVRAMFCDVAYWESMVKIHWPGKHGKSVYIWAKKAGKDPHVFGYDLRGNQFEWTQAVELVQREIIQAAEERRKGTPQTVAFSHDDNPVLARHVLNAQKYFNRWGTAIRKRTRQSPDKIDGAVAMILSRLARRLYLVELAKHPKRSGRVV
jgi:hypothetical protein